MYPLRGDIRFMEHPADRFSRAIAAFDSYHRKDPDTEEENGEAFPAELLYAARMTRTLARMSSDASETVKLAARCQHIGRWEIPRENYPMDKKGYLQWRNAEKLRHAQIAEEILGNAGYDADSIAKVKRMVLKKELSTNPEAQLLEDVACLVFIEHYLPDFAARHADEKVIDILRKTLRKMSAPGRQAIESIAVPARIRSLLARAVSPAG